MARPWSPKYSESPCLRLLSSSFSSSSAEEKASPVDCSPSCAPAPAEMRLAEPPRNSTVLVEAKSPAGDDPVAEIFLPTGSSLLSAEGVDDGPTDSRAGPADASAEPRSGVEDTPADSGAGSSRRDTATSDAADAVAAARAASVSRWRFSATPSASRAMVSSLSSSSTLASMSTMYRVSSWTASSASPRCSSASLRLVSTRAIFFSCSALTLSKRPMRLFRPTFSMRTCSNSTLRLWLTSLVLSISTCFFSSCDLSSSRVVVNFAKSFESPFSRASRRLIRS